MTVEDQYQTKFILPKIIDNVNGWGPIETDIPEALVDVPYTPFSKSEAIGKVADWTQSQDTHDKRRNYQNRNADQIYGSGLTNAFNYHFAAEEESSFSLVDRAVSTAKKTSGYRPQKQNRQNGRNPRQNFRGGYQQGYNRGRRNFNRQDPKIIDDSVKIGEQWDVVEELDMNSISKATLSVEEPTDITVCGTLNYYNPAVDSISCRAEVPLKENNRIIHNPSTADDEIIQSIAKSTEGRAVFATDSIISTLMCATRSVYPWDIIITKYRNQIFFDKRDDSQSFDYYTVNENSGELPGDPNDKSGINTPIQLSEETTSNCKNFIQQAVNEDLKYQFKKGYPFSEDDDEENIGSVAFRYRKWSLKSGSEQPISLIVRTTLDAAYQQKNSNSNNNCESMEPKDSKYPIKDTMFLNVRTVDEFDLTRNLSWRKQLDNQKVGFISSEFKSNLNKLSKWAVESILSGADQIKFGFISRINSRNNKNHSILGTHFFTPKNIARHLDLNIENSWGILKEIVDKLMKLDDGKFVLVKDAVKNTFTLYSVPENAFDESENEDDEL